MTQFINTQTGDVITLAPGVEYTESGGVYSFTLNGNPLDWPTTLQPYTPPLSYFQTQQIAQLSNACMNAILSGIPVTLSSGSYTLANTPTDQVNALMASQTAQGVLTKAQAWAASTSYGANSFCSVGAVILWTAKGGTSGTTQPTAPTEFSAPVTDNGVTWELFGMLARLAAGGTIYLTPQDIISAFEQGVAYVEAQRGQYRQLKAQVLAATTVVEVQAVVWP